MSKRKDTPCKFWLEGRCERGEACQFLHPEPAEEPAPKRIKGKGKGSEGRQPDHEYSNVFKIAFPDHYIACLIGASGASRQQIEQECHAHIQISGRDLFFPGTRCRKLIISADAPQNIIEVLDKIVDRSVERIAEDERKGKGKGDAEADALVGKEAGEIVFRVLLPKSAVGRLMGTGGETIKQIHYDSGAKLYVENDSIHHAHQILKMIGRPDSLKSALPAIVDVVNDELAEMPIADWPYSMVVDDGAGGYQTAPSGTPFGTKGKGGGGGKGSKHDSDNGYHEKGGGGGSASLEGMIDISRAFSNGTLEMAYEISCELPHACVGSLIGARGVNSRWVEEETGARIDFSKDKERADGLRTMTITGPLFSVYQAHMRMMQQYHLHNAEKEAEEEAESKKQDAVAAMQAQIAALANQLDELQGSSKKPKGKGKK